MKVKLNAVKRELEQLDIQVGSEAYDYILDQATHAADILTKSELIQLVRDHAENFSFAQCGH